MVTRNFLNILAMALQSTHPQGCLPVRSVTGEHRFLTGIFANLATVTTFTLDANAAGISIGTGDTPASEDDYNLEETITAGVTVTITDTEYGAASPWYPCIKFDLTITNTSENTVIVTEVGYKQTVSTSKVLSSTTRANTVLLIDRCVLATPVTIAPGDAGIVTYRLQTNPVPPLPVVAGVQMASFSFGSDAQIAAILDAARAGTVDLQRDAGWKIGDQRVIDIAAFTAAGDVAVPAQQAVIAISSFEEYMNCGNVMQFDFPNALTSALSINSSYIFSGGYGVTEMKTVTLPAVAEALPVWLSTRLLTFSVLEYNAGAMGTVTDNKLALRSQKEVYGTGSEEGAPIAYYAQQPDMRKKGAGINGTNNAWWLRTHSDASAPRFVVADGGFVSDTFTNYTKWVAPFGCL